MENNESLRPEPEESVDGARRFSVRLRRIRLGLRTKQVGLSGAIGCSDAAVSLWESGARIPTPHSMRRLLAALAEEGTPTSELLELRGVWLNEYARRRAARRG
jgi:transcriptional regulator with XRE-family HTH domain